MPLSSIQESKITQLLRNKLDKKLRLYERETKSMPFLERLMQDNEKVAAYSFIQSLLTTLGMSIYEEVSAIIASEHSETAYSKHKVGGVISASQKTVISSIISSLRNRDRTADIKKEKEEVLQASTENGQPQKSGNVADLYMKKNNEEYYFEIKTVKPNIDVFEKSKTKLLEWVARKQSPVHVFLAFPYNPYYPKPYSRFTEVGMMDPPNDFLIGSEYWDFIGGQHTLPALLNIFNEVGKEYKKQFNEALIALARKKPDSY